MPASRLFRHADPARTSMFSSDVNLDQSDGDRASRSAWRQRGQSAPGAGPSTARRRR
jgi:hypothetical protein